MIEINERRIKSRENIRNHIIQNESQQIYLVNRTITILYELNRQVLQFYRQNESTKKEFKEDYAKQAVQTLFKKSTSQIETILILIENGKYLEAYSILRNLFESSILLLYIIVYPFEADRWLSLVNMDFKAREKYGKMKFDDFKSFLEKNNYLELLKFVTLKNYWKYRDFSVGYIREQAFKNHPSIKGMDFKEFYFELCKFVHPSIKGLNHNDTLNDTMFRDIIADSLHISKNIADIYIEYFQGALMNHNIVKDFLNIEQEINNNGRDMSKKIQSL
jgi:hypothetical protein